MDVAVSSGHLDIDEALRVATQEKVGRLARYLDGVERAEVRFTEEHNPRIADKEVCEVTIVAHGHVVRAKAAATERIAALDYVVDKLTRRLERLKGRLLARSHPKHRGGLADFVPPSEDGPAPDEQRIVKTKQFAIKPMTPEEASLQMELLSHSFFFFTNAETGRAAVVYRRNDGDIGLIDGDR